MPQPRAARTPALHRALLVLLVVAPIGVIALNTFQHDVRWTFDYRRQMDCFKTFDSLRSWDFHVLPNVMSYNSPLYYYMVEKVSALSAATPFGRIHEFHVARLMHLAFFGIIASLFTFSLIPHLCNARQAGPRSGKHAKETPRRDGLKSPFLLQLLFLLGVFAIPNLYVAHVMARTDHLLFFCVHLLFYLWFRFDYANTLATSLPRQVTWAVLLIVMANTRQYAFPGIALFFLLGVIALWRGYRYTQIGTGKRYAMTGLLLLMVIGLSGFHYAHRYFATGRVGATTIAKYQKRMKSPKFSRTEMLTNMQFGVMWETPNRDADYRGGNFDVALWPRLYNDMWADYWCYFSGPNKTETKLLWKRVVLIAGLPLTVLIFGSIAYCCVIGLGSAVRLRRLQWYEVAGLLAMACVCLLLLTNFIYPRPGKVTLAKFTYLIGYFWLGVLCMVYVASQWKQIGWACVGSAAVAFILSIPLNIFACPSPIDAPVEPRTSLRPGIELRHIDAGHESRADESRSQARRRAPRA